MIHDLQQIRTLMHAAACSHTRLSILRTKLRACIHNPLLSYAHQPLHREEIEYVLRHLCERRRPAYHAGRIDADFAVAYSAVAILAVRAMTPPLVTWFQRFAGVLGGIVLLLVLSRVLVDLVDLVKGATSTWKQRQEWEEESALREKLEACFFKLRLEGKEWSHELP